MSVCSLLQCYLILVVCIISSLSKASSKIWVVETGKALIMVNSLITGSRYLSEYKYDVCD